MEEMVNFILAYVVLVDLILLPIPNHTYINTSIHTYIHTYMHTYMHTYTHTYMQTYIKPYILYTYIHT